MNKLQFKQYPKIKWARRIYLLEGKKIKSNQCLGILHRSTKTQSERCIICDKEILKNEQYIIMNTLSPYYWHAKCLVEESPDSIIGISVKQRVVMSHGIQKQGTVIMCKKLQELEFIKELTH